MIHTPIFFIVSLVALAIGAFLHVRGCMKFQAYGTSERIPLWKDKYGFFDLPKYVVSLVVFVGVVGGIHLAWLGYQTGIIFYVMAASQFVLWWYNERGMKKNRAIQTSILSQLKSLSVDTTPDPIGPAVDRIINASVNFKSPNPIVAKGGRVWYRLFPWLYVEGDSTSARELPAIIALREKIIAWSQRPEKDWFL